MALGLFIDNWGPMFVDEFQADAHATKIKMSIIHNRIRMRPRLSTFDCRMAAAYSKVKISIRWRVRPPSCNIDLDRVWRRQALRRNTGIRRGTPGKRWLRARRRPPMSGRVSVGRNQRWNMSPLGRHRNGTIPNNPDRHRGITRRQAIRNKKQKNRIE